MIDKTNTDGMKLYSGGKEVTREDVEKAIADYEQRKNSAEYQEEMQKIGELFDKKTNNNCKYYQLSLEPHTIFKVDYDIFKSYRLDENQQAWTEFPVFLVDLEHGNITVNEISINDTYPTISAVDQRKGITL